LTARQNAQKFCLKAPIFVKNAQNIKKNKENHAFLRGFCAFCILIEPFSRQFHQKHLRRSNTHHTEGAYIPSIVRHKYSICAE
jgi:hypothetical protein